MVLCSTISRWSPISCLSPTLMLRHRSQLRARNCAISYQETHMCEAEEGMSAVHSCPPRRQAFIVSTQFCYLGAVGYFLQSHLLPRAQSYSLTHQAAWFCRAMPELVLPTPKHFCFTLGKKKRQKLPATKNFAFPPHPENSRSVQSYLQVWVCIPWIFYIDIIV